MKIQLVRCVLLASVSLVFTHPAFAQDSSAADAAASAEASATTAEPAVEENSGGLEDIVITAQRRAQNNQDVPIAVTAVTASVAQSLGITNTESVAQIVPGLALNRSSQGVTPFLRGVGTNSSTIGNEPSVAMFIDDVYVPTGTASVFDFNNIASIEVLKGPQGTLFGRNATGGVIHIRTKNPTFDPTVSATATYANYDTWSGQVYASTGLTDDIAVNIAGYYVDQKDGWGTNIVTGNDVFDAKSYGVRGKMLFQIGDSTEALLSASFDRRRSSQGQANRVVPGTFTRGGYSPDAAGAGFYDATTDIDPYYINKFQQYSLKLSHDFDNARFVSITAYSQVTGAPSNLDIDASPTPFFNAYTGQGSKTWTQEFQLLSPDNAQVNWIIGAFFLSDRSYFKADFRGQAFGTSHADVYAVQKTGSISGFAQADTEIFDKTRLTIGVRYTSDHRELTGIAKLISASGGVTNFGPFNDSETFSSLTGRFSLDHKFGDNVLGYIAFNRGFKSGVYNIAGVTVGTTAIQAPVKPEDLNAYTIGFKSELFDRLIRLNVEGYYYDYKNIQVQNVIPGGTILTNGGAATIKGVEAEITAVPTNNLTLTVSAAYAHGRYDEFDGGPQFFPLAPNTPVEFIQADCPGQTNPYTSGATGPIAQRACNLAGNKTIQTPPFTMNASAVYKIPTSFGDFDVAASWALGGKYYFEADNNPSTRQGRTNIVNASLQWSAPNEAFTARLWANNLTKEKYYSYIAQSTSTGAKYSPGAPRTYGVTLGVNF